MKSIKNYIKIILFLSSLFLIITFLSYLFIPKNNLKEFGMIEVAANGILGEPDNTIDVVVIGDSLTYTAFSPMQMYSEHGFTSYICGTSAQRLYDSYSFFTTSIKKQKPKVVVLETNALFRDYTFVNTVISGLKKSFPYLNYHNRWKNLSINDLTENVNYTYTDNKKGYKLIKESRASKPKDYMKYKSGVHPIPKKNITYVKKIKEKCDELGIEFILVSSNTQKNMNYKKHNSIKKLSEELNIPYLDMNLQSEINIDWTTETKDKGDHLNYLGAKKATSFLGDYLVKNYKLPSHFGDPKYITWDNEVEKYNILVS